MVEDNAPKMADTPAQIVHHRCQFMLPKKRRLCRLTVRADQEYCAEHVLRTSSSASSTRVVCPLDGKHTVDVDQLQDHMANKCNARLPTLPWIERNVNRTMVDDEEGERRWREMGVEEKMSKIHKLVPAIERVHAAHRHSIESLHLAHPSMTDLIDDVSVSDGKRKHHVQQSSVLAHMEREGWMSRESDTLYVEFGAGKAQLSYRLADAMDTSTSSRQQYLIVDQAGTRQKYDNKARREHSDISPNIRRLRCGIEHLRIDRVDEIAEQYLKVDADRQVQSIGLCKHLCGAATDFALRCACPVERSNLRFTGLALIPCCHHRLTFGEYAGRLPLDLGVDAESWPTFRHISTWAICGFGKKGECSPSDGKKGECSPSDGEKCEEDMSDARKEELGRMVKLLIELGRKAFLEDQGFDVKLYYYVPKAVTPENILIMAKRT